MSQTRLTEAISYLREQLSRFQKQIVAFQEEALRVEKETESRETVMNLGVIEIVDAMDKLLTHWRKKQEPAVGASDNSGDSGMEKVLANLESIQRKIIRFLDEQGTKKMEMSDQKAQPQYCKILETREDPSRDNGDIIELIRTGYHRDGKVLRPMEVVTVRNQEV